MDDQSIDFGETDVFRMAKETGIDIFVIYHCLYLPLDPQAQRLVDRLEEAESPIDWQIAFLDMTEYSVAMGNEEARDQIIPDPLSENYDPEEKWEAREKAVELARIRNQTKVLWGTEEQHQVVYDLAGSLFLDVLLDYYEEMPQAAYTERQIVVQMIALRFFQRQTEEEPTL